MIRWSLLLLALLMLSACAAPAAPPPSDVVGYPPAEPADPTGDFRSDPVEAIAATGRPQLLEFYATWCWDCNLMKETVHRMEGAFFGEVDFVYLDNDNPATEAAQDRYGVVGQPVFVLVDSDGQEVQRFHGQVPARELRQALRSLADG